MILEDDIAIGALVAETARRSGARPTVRATVDSCVDALRRTSPDVLWVDLLLADAHKSGWLLIERCIREKLYSGRLVICTVVPDIEQRHAELLALARQWFTSVTVLQKPATVDEIVAALEGR